MAVTATQSVTADQARAMMQAALNAPIPRLYVNSFMNASTESDIMTILQCNGQNTCIMNFSYMTAKAWAIALTELVSDYERRHKLEIPALKQEIQDSSGQIHPMGGPR